MKIFFTFIFAFFSWHLHIVLKYLLSFAIPFIYFPCCAMCLQFIHGMEYVDHLHSYSNAFLLLPMVRMIHAHIICRLEAVAMPMELMVVILQDVLVALGKNFSFFIILSMHLACAFFS